MVTCATSERREGRGGGADLVAWATNPNGVFLDGGHGSDGKLHHAAILLIFHRSSTTKIRLRESEKEREIQEEKGKVVT